MFISSRAVFGVSFGKKILKMLEANTGINVLEDLLKHGENGITQLQKEMKELILMQEDYDRNKVQSLINENKKLQNEINLVKKHLIQLQVANGIPQIPVPGEDSEVKESPSKASYEKPASAQSTNSENVGNAEIAVNESKPAKASKPKKQQGPAEDEPPIDFGRLDIRVGKILHVQFHPDATQLYIEQIEVGEETSRTVVSGLVGHVPTADLDDRMVVVLCNLKPQKMRGIVSEAMVLCASTPETVELLTPPPEAKAGDKIIVPGYTRNPDLPFMNPKKKIFEKISEDLRVNSKKQASYKDIPWQIEGKPGFVTVQTLSGCHIK